MSSAAIEIVIVVALIIANGVFSMSETAIISSRKARLQQRADEGDANASAALKLAQTPANFLATVQIGITVIGILAGAFSGATLSEQLSSVIKTTFPTLEIYSETISFVIVVLLITILSLVIGELVPKSLALNNPERVAAAIAIPMSLLSKVMLPFVIMLNKTTNLILRLIGIKPSDEPSVTEDEIRMMVKQGAQTGTFQKAESQLVDQVFRLDDLRISSIMTPRTAIVWLETNDSQEVIQKKILENPFSYYPVVKEGPDNVFGIIWVKDLLASHYKRETPDLQVMAVKPLFVPVSTTALRMLDIFEQAQTHIALVVDEYGGLEGMITINDVLNEIVGGAMSIAHATEIDVVRREDGSFLIDGRFAIDKLRELLGLSSLPDDPLYETLGGFVMTHTGNIPVAGDTFNVEDWHFEVVDMDGRRVDKVLVQQKPVA